MDLMIMAPVFFLSRSIDFSDPDTLLKARILFFCSVGVVSAAMLYIYTQINAKKDMTKIEVKKSSSPWGASEEAVMEEKTVHEYDMDELSSYVRSYLMGIGISLFLQFQMGIFQSMIYQALMGPYNLYKNNLCKIHILNYPAVGSLKRPFPVTSIFSMFTDQGNAGGASEEELEDQDVDGGEGGVGENNRETGSLADLD